MRFRYFDAEGTEVGLSSVDALRFRIQTGVVTPETLLYDAAAGQWAPARRNPLFRFLVEEEEDLLPEEHRPLMEEAATDASAESVAESPAPWPSPKASFDPEELDAALDRGLDSLADERVSRDAGVDDDAGPPEIELVPPTGEEAPPTHSPSSSSTADELPGSESFTDPELFSDLELLPQPEPPPEPAPRPDPGAPSDSTSVPQAASPSPTEANDPGEDEPGDSRRSSFPSPPPASDASTFWASSDSGTTSGRSRPRRRRRPPSLAGVAALSILMVFLVGIPILVLGGGEGGSEDGAAYALVGSLTDDLMSDVEARAPADPSVAPDEPPVEAGGVPETDPAATAPSERLDAEELEGLAADVDAAASGELEDALADLRVALNVPRTPPAEWLRGAYLAKAASYPQVERYWVGFSSLVHSMEELEGELYRRFVQSRVLGMRLDTADTARLSARALERYEERSEERAGMYRELDLLASNALALHDTLVARTAEISYRPFDGTTFSRYPVMAAVPDDPVLAEQIWGRMTRSLDLLDSLDGVRPTSLTELRAAVRRVTPGSSGDPGGDLPDLAELPAPSQNVPVPD